MRRCTKIKLFIYLITLISLVACMPMANPTLSQNDEKATNRPVAPAPVSTNTPMVQVVIRTLISADETRNTPTIQVAATTPVPFRSRLQMKVSNGDLTAEVQEIDLNPDYPTITLCTDLPSVADWLPRFSAIYHGRGIQVAGWMLLDPNNNTAHSKNRCYLVTLSTEIFDFDVPSGELIFLLDYFEASIPENMPDQTNPPKVFGPWRFTINLSQ